MADRLRASAAANPAARLAAAMAAGVRNGRDKLTIVAPDDQATFGLWLEQLLAESTGKDGTGVVPVVGEPLAGPEAYGDDRLFVALGDDTGAAELSASGRRRPPGGRAAVRRRVRRPRRAGAAVGDGHRAGAARCSASSPFDQPDVAAAKAATAKVLAEGPPTIDETPLDDLLGQVGPGDYLAIQAFVDPGSPSRRARSSGPGWRCATGSRVATTVGLGPRFLHSTGQLHKGGPNTGVFVQVVGDDPDDVAIPGAPYGFATLERAQADGDLLTLRDRGPAGRPRAPGDLVEETTMKIGMVGLGKMGGNMAERLGAAGHEVVGYDPHSRRLAGRRRSTELVARARRRPGWCG